jgi:hypothetical protein
MTPDKVEALRKILTLLRGVHVGFVDWLFLTGLQRVLDRDPAAFQLSPRQGECLGEIVNRAIEEAQDAGKEKGHRLGWPGANSLETLYFITCH